MYYILISTYSTFQNSKALHRNSREVTWTENLLVEFLFDIGHPLEVCRSRGISLRRVLDLVLLGKVIQGFDRRLETGHSQEGGQIGGIWSDNNESKQPPGGRYQSAREISWSFATSLRCQRCHAEPQTLLQGELTLLVVVLVLFLVVPENRLRDA